MTESLSRQSLGFDFESPVYRFGPLQTTASNALCVPIIYGQIKAAGNKIWQSEGTAFNALIAFGEGPISEISNVKINDYPVSELKITPTIYLGDGTKNVDTRVTGANNAERANLVGGLRYTAYLALSVKSGTKVTRSYMNVTADIKGKKVYTYSTAGVKSDAPVYSNNPSWCILDFLTSQSGCAMSVNELDIQSFVAAAEYCDAKINPIEASGTVKCTAGKYVVTGAGTKFSTEVKIGETITIGSDERVVTAISSDTSLTVDLAFSTTINNSTTKMIVKDTRYTLNLILDERKSRNKWLAQMLNTCRGNLKYNAEQKLILVIEQDVQPSDYIQDFTPNDIIVGSERFWTTQKEQKADILKVRYIYPTEQCARVFAVAEADKFLNDPPIVQELELLGVTNFKQASRLAWYYLNQSNNCNKFISFATTQVALNRTVGDVITLTSTILNYQKKKMRITNINQAQSGQIQITCREHNGAESSVLTTDFTTANSNLIFTSIAKEDAANNITIQYTDPYAISRSLSVSVNNKDINVSLATDGLGAVTTTAAQIKTAIEAHTTAKTLVTVAYATGNVGTGVVAAMPKTSLKGGNTGIYTDIMGSVEPEINIINTNDAFEVPDNVTGFQATQILNQVQFNWSEVAGPNITYEIREGGSWETGSATTGLTGNSKLLTLSGIGTKSYWIKAKTKYGTYSQNAAEVILFVTDIPLANTLVETNLTDSPSGTFIDTFISNGKLKLATDGTNWEKYLDDTWSENNPKRTYCQNSKWGCSVLTSGTYTSQEYDLGSEAENVSYTINYETYLAGDTSSSIIVEVRFSSDAQTWEDWKVYEPSSGGQATFRYYQIRATLNSPNKNQIYLSNCILKIDVDDRIEHYSDLTIVDANAGYVLNFKTDSQSKKAKPFNVTPAVIVTPEAQSGIVISVTYSDKTKDCVTIKLINAASGAFITGRFDCVVKGY